VDSWVQRAALELQKAAKAYARGETRQQVAQWERLSPAQRRRWTRPEPLSQVRAKYNDLLRHAGGSGPWLPLADHPRCW
jgi:hypothetical protein